MENYGAMATHMKKNTYDTYNYNVCVFVCDQRHVKIRNFLPSQDLGVVIQWKNTLFKQN